MAAAPKNAILKFQGQSGAQYVYNVYLSDVNASFATWNTVQAAGTSDTNFITAPENMVLVDAAVPTGLTDTTSGTFWLNDGPVPNTIMAWAPIVNTLATRSFPNIKISAGRKVQIKQNT